MRIGRCLTAEVAPTFPLRSLRETFFNERFLKLNPYGVVMGHFLRLFVLKPFRLAGSRGLL